MTRKTREHDSSFISARAFNSIFVLSAEFILDVIGAGASATADQDWHAVWEKSPEAQEVQKQIQDIHEEGRRKGAVEATVNAKFATSWMTQTTELLRRDLRNHWRDPTYLMAKFVLNIAAGLFIGVRLLFSLITSMACELTCPSSLSSKPRTPSKERRINFL